MRLELIQINNFRNLEQVTIRPAAGINLLVGKNAQGKTNFLEALYVLAHGTSFRPYAIVTWFVTRRTPMRLKLSIRKRDVCTEHLTLCIYQRQGSAYK